MFSHRLKLPVAFVRLPALLLFSLAALPLVPSSVADEVSYWVDRSADFGAYIHPESEIVYYRDDAGRYLSEGPTGEVFDFIVGDAYARGKSSERTGLAESCAGDFCVAFKVAVLGPADAGARVQISDACGERTYSDSFPVDATSAPAATVVSLLGQWTVKACSPGVAEGSVTVTSQLAQYTSLTSVRY